MFNVEYITKSKIHGKVQKIDQFAQMSSQISALQLNKGLLQFWKLYIDFYCVFFSEAICNRWYNEQ